MWQSLFRLLLNFDHKVWLAGRSWNSDDPKGFGLHIGGKPQGPCDYLSWGKDSERPETLVNVARCYKSCKTFPCLHKSFGMCTVYRHLASTNISTKPCRALIKRSHNNPNPGLGRRHATAVWEDDVVQLHRPHASAVAPRVMLCRRAGSDYQIYVMYSGKKTER